jgi:hypothetical protein
LSLEQFEWFNWPIPRLVAWVLGYHEKELDTAMIAEIQQSRQRKTPTMMRRKKVNQKSGASAP